jgi:protein TonB
MAKQGRTLLVSVLVHVCGLVVLVVAPLVAFDGIPDVKSTLRFTAVEMKIPKLPVVRPAVASNASTAPRPDGPPLSAPTEIRPERPPVPSTINIPGTEGLGDVLSGAGLGATETGVTPPPPPKPNAPQMPVRPGGNIKTPVRTVYVRPDYPPTAIAARISGTVVIEAIIDTDGTIRDARVLRSVPLLDAAALAAVRQWRYTPTQLNGVPVAVIMTVTVTFTLGEPGGVRF